MGACLFEDFSWMLTLDGRQRAPIVAQRNPDTVVCWRWACQRSWQRPAAWQTADHHHYCHHRQHSRRRPCRATQAPLAQKPPEASLEQAASAAFSAVAPALAWLWTRCYRGAGQHLRRHLRHATQVLPLRDLQAAPGSCLLGVPAEAQPLEASSHCWTNAGAPCRVAAAACMGAQRSAEPQGP